MNKFHFTVTIMPLCALLAGAAGARDLLAPQTGDLAATAVVAPAALQSNFGVPGVRRESVALSWAAGHDITPPAPHVAHSRQYHFEASGDELAAGVTLNTTAARALVRLQPLAAPSPREAVAIDPSALVIEDARGRSFAGGAGMSLLVGADKMAKAELPFAPGTSAFRLHPDLGAGSFRLKAAGLSGAARYLVNVVEPDSAHELTLQADALAYLHGQVLVLAPALLEHGTGASVRSHALAKLEGSVISPAGRRFVLSFKPGPDGALRARLPLDANEAPTPGLWQVQASGQAVVAGQAVMRSIALAFPVAMPVARLSGAVTADSSAQRLALTLGVQAGAPGRYEVRGLLYGMVDGAMAPLAVAHAAQWLEAGTGSIVLAFDADLLAGAHGPFELRELNLLDQGRMGVLHRQRRALVLDDGEVLRPAAALARAELHTKDLLQGSN
jgi:hypothetical protein